MASRMPVPELDNLVRAGQLKTGEASPAEIAGLIRSGMVRVKDARRADLDVVSRFDLAYNAAHALALAALRARGYRSENRYIVFQCLAHTVSPPSEQWRVLADAHRKRNIAEYEDALEIEASQVDAICRVTDEVALRVGGLGASVETK